MREATYDLEVIIAAPARLAGKCSPGQGGNEDDYFLVPGLETGEKCGVCHEC